MDIKDTFIATNAALTELVGGIRPEHLPLVMPRHAQLLPDQTVRATLNLLAYENACVPRVLAGETGLATNSDFADDLLGDDVAGSYRRLGELANDTARDHQNMEHIVHISYGDVTAAGYLSDISINRALALYDLADITGLEPRLADDVLAELHGIAAGVADMLREMEIFPPELRVTADAGAEDRFLALVGRRPRDPAVLVA